ncbi:hypothetical protein Ciccas_011440 [Cichlidogyrus casuarinus]|uniref:Uncharacterized protein n=1 Tax=Cichlidogyrus casuarinus TaxID=1844966 RepID=A0ABD2PS25_9PLAT
MTLFELLCRQINPPGTTLTAASQYGGSLSGGMSSLFVPKTSSVLIPGGTTPVQVTLRNNPASKILRRRTLSMRDSFDESQNSPLGSKLAVGSQDINSLASPQEQAFSKQVELAFYGLRHLRSGFSKLEKSASVLYLGESFGQDTPEDAERPCSEMTHFRLQINQLKSTLKSLQLETSCGGSILEQDESEMVMGRESPIDVPVSSCLPESMLMDESEYEARYRQSASFLDSVKHLTSQSSPFDCIVTSHQYDNQKFSQHLDFLRSGSSKRSSGTKRLASTNKSSAITRDSTRASLRLKSPTSNTVRFDQTTPRGCATVTNDERETLGRVAAGITQSRPFLNQLSPCYSVPDLVSMDQKSKSSKKEGSSLLSQRGSLLSTSGLLIPAPEHEAVQAEDFKPIASDTGTQLDAHLAVCDTLNLLPPINRDDLLSLATRLPEHLANILTG